MANYSILKQAIQDVVRTNGNNEITGALLQQSLLTMVNSLGVGYQYAGIATPAINPGTPDQNVFYLASTAGTYANFGGLVLADGEIAILKYNGTWTKDVTGAASLEKVNQLSQVSPNNDINEYIREMYIDFGDSGFSLSDVKILKMRHQDPDAFQLVIYDSTYSEIANFGYQQHLSNYFYEGENNGIKVKILFNPDAPGIPETWFTTNISFYDTVLDLQTQPILYALMADKSIQTLIEQESERAQTAEEKNSEDISDIQNAITKTTIVDVTSQVTLIDNQVNHSINTDGSFGTDAMYLRKFKVEGGFSLDLKTRAYINSGITSLMYAFYSSESVFDATTFISGSQPYTGVYVSQLSFENVIIPSNAKTIVFADRGGGTTQLVVTYKTIDIVSGESIKQVLDYPASKTIKYIKSDGTGDYTTIQDAINAITDASFVNQYELRLCNDEIYTDVTDLWIVSSPSTHNANANPTSAIAAIITKDWISIVGYGGRRKVAVYAPDSMDVTKQGNVQTMYLMGNTTIDNVDFEIKNGRYAIHQESAGSILSLDHNARTILKNSNVTHLGNKIGTGYWSSCYAQANGTCSGLQLEYHNVVWAPAFYMHQNGNVETNNSYLFKNCRIDYPANGEFNGASLGVYIGMNGSGQNPDIQFYGCDMWQMTFVIDMFDNNVAGDYAHDIRSYIPNWVGCGNAIMKYPQIDIANNVLTFRTNDVNHSISVVGGTAKSIIFGDGFRTYEGTPNAWGICYGSEYIGKRGNNAVFTLGNRLGDCTTTNKTLIVKYDSNEYTLTFNEDYTNMDNGTIRQKIDTMLSTLGVGAVTTTQLIHQLQFSYPMKDTSVIGRNYGTMAFQNGAALKRDYANGMGWTLCSAGETPDGVACERINPNGSGVIALIDKNYFPPLFGLYGGVKPVGTMLKTGADGAWQETTTEGEAILIAVAPDCFVKK